MGHYEVAAVYIVVRVTVAIDSETRERTRESDQRLNDVVNELVERYGADDVRHVVDGDGTMAEEFPA